MAEPAPPLVVRTDDDILAAVPALLGFHPDDSVVVVAFAPTGVVFTVRLDLDHVRALTRPSAPLAGAFAQLGDDAAERVTAVVVGYGDDRAATAREVTRMVADLPLPVMLAAVVVGDRWWCLGDDPDDPGRRHDPASSRVLAQAAYAGHQVLPSRRVLAERLDPPSGRLPRGVTRVFQRAARIADAELAYGWRMPLLRMREVLESLDPAQPPTLEQMAMLVGLARLPMGREAVWQLLDRDTAPGFVALWTQVVQVTPKRWRAIPLGMLAFAAWQAGEGALMTICLDRAAQLSPRHPVVQALEHISAHQLSPLLWDAMIDRGRVA